MATVQQAIITPALEEIGVIAQGEAPSAGDSNSAFARLNRFIDRLATERQAIFTITRTTATLTASQTSFSVGSGGNINIARPVHVERINFIDTSFDPDHEFPLSLLTEQAWQGISEKARTATYPQAAYYNPTLSGAGTATLHPWPIPTSSTLQWAFYHWTALTQFSAVTDTVTVPPAYLEMLVTNLAILLCPAYERQPHPVLVEAARTSMAAVKRVNKRMADLSFESAALIGNGGAYSIYEG